MSNVKKSEEDWKAELTPEQYKITRQGGTECAFTGPYWDAKDKGVYNCRCCGTPLFNSETKYDSGSGWPSFYQPLDAQAIEEREDNSLLSRRTEVVCAKCEAHLGHVFPDGPQPTGLRYCINGASLHLAKDED